MHIRENYKNDDLPGYFAEDFKSYSIANFEDMEKELKQKFGDQLFASGLYA